MRPAEHRQREQTGVGQENETEKEERLLRQYWEGQKPGTKSEGA